jgi:hypothetical protein
MIRRKIMNNKDQENGALRGPLIFTVPASHFPFLVALGVGWLDVTDNVTVAAAPRFGDLRAS